MLRRPLIDDVVGRQGRQSKINSCGLNTPTLGQGIRLVSRCSVSNHAINHMQWAHACKPAPTRVGQVLLMKTRAISASLFAIVLGMLATATPAQAAASVTSVSDGTIVGKGTAVQGTYTVECQFFEERISVNMELRQRAGGKTVTSSTFNDSFLCAGNGVPVTRTYTFSNSGTTFKSGVATVTGNISACNDFFFCTNEAIFEEISLAKAK